MVLFHRHDWREAERFYAAPRDTFKADRISSELIAFLTLGGTTIVVQRCAVCGKERLREYVGKASA
jgi:hypothetical protein